MRRRKLVTVLGARPQFIKAGALSRALAADGRIDEVLVHSGQHADPSMSDVFFAELALAAPKYNLGIAGGSHGQMTGRMLAALDPVLRDEKPDAVLVYGDTNTTLAGALGAAQLQIPLVHVEAGLRSHNRRMPEETNRVVADHIAALLLCPTRGAVANLAKEGVNEGVRHVGDVMYDAALHAKSVGPSTILEQVGASDGFVLCTIHRAENTDDAARFASLLAHVVQVAAGRKIIFPVHPRTRALFAAAVAPANLTAIDPVGYFDMHRLIGACDVVMTDSGGLQKEAYFHAKPCVTLREETEWTETVDAGWNRLWRSADYKAPRQPITDYGDGHAAEKCVAAITETLA